MLPERRERQAAREYLARQCCPRSLQDEGRCAWLPDADQRGPETRDARGVDRGHCAQNDSGRTQADSALDRLGFNTLILPAPRFDRRMLHLARRQRVWTNGF